MGGRFVTDLERHSGAHLTIHPQQPENTENSPPRLENDQKDSPSLETDATRPSIPSQLTPHDAVTLGQQANQATFIAGFIAGQAPVVTHCPR